MIPTSDFKKGISIEVDNVPYLIVECQHVKPGKGNAFIRTRLKNLVNNSVVEKTFKSGEKVGAPDLEEKDVQYLYSDAQGYQFMDLETFEQFFLTQDQVGDSRNYLIDNLEFEMLYYQNRPITLKLPNFVVLEVVETEPGIKGDTASGGGKPATVTTGLTVTVPFHIKVGDKLKIDTRTADYVEKIKS